MADYRAQSAESPYYGMVTNQMMTFIVVGYTTTTSAMRWIVTSLAQKPEEEKRIASEVRNVCNGRDLSYEDYEKLVYTQAFVMEVLRVNPPLAFIVREAIADDRIENYLLPAGGCAVLSVHHMHRHPDYWSDPESFNPERFVAKPNGQDFQYAYLPFGAGKRACIARNFALLELTLVTAMMTQRFHFTLPRDFRLKRKYIASFFVRPNLESVMIREK
jgi:cytochrome P450